MKKLPLDRHFMEKHHVNGKINVDGEVAKLIQIHSF